MTHMTRLLTGLLLVAAAVTVGCGPKHIALSDETATQIKTVKVISVIAQEMVVPTVQPSAGAQAGAGALMMFGAIGGAIGGAIIAADEISRGKAAALKLASLVEPHRRLGLRQEFLDRLRLAAEGSDRFIIQEGVSVTKGDGEDERDQALKEMAQDAVLVVLTTYYLSLDFKVLNVSSKSELWQKEGKQRVYLGGWHYHSAPRAGENDERVIEAWSANDGESFVSAAREAIDKTTSMMQIDLLGAPGDPENLGMMSFSYAGPNRGEKTNVEGKILLRQSGWMVVRAEDGNLHAIHASGSDG